MSQPSPLFLCGHAKSGTTLLLALLDGHPELLVFPEETKYFKRILGQPEKRNLDTALKVTGAKALRQGRLDDTQGRRDYSGLDYAEYEDCARQRWAASDKSDRALLESLVFAYGDATRQTERRYWVEKTPGNEFYLERVRGDWPDLRAIYIVRDPRSVFDTQRHARHSVGWSLPPEEFVVYWRDSVQTWQRFAARSSNGLLIRYDDLVQDAPGVMRRVCGFLGIAWDDTLLQPTRGGTPWSGNSRLGAAFEGISIAPLERYRASLPPAEIKTLEVWLGRLMADFGWQTLYGKPSMTARARELLFGGSRDPKLKLTMIRRTVLGYLRRTRAA